MTLSSVEYCILEATFIQNLILILD